MADHGINGFIGFLIKYFITRYILILGFLTNSRCPPYTFLPNYSSPTQNRSLELLDSKWPSEKSLAGFFAHPVGTQPVKKLNFASFIGQVQHAIVVPLCIICAFILGATLSSRAIFSLFSIFLRLGGTYQQRGSNANVYLKHMKCFLPKANIQKLRLQILFSTICPVFAKQMPQTYIFNDHFKTIDSLDFCGEIIGQFLGWDLQILHKMYLPLLWVG